MSPPRSSSRLQEAAPHVRVVEVGARDGLQNESQPVATEVKALLIERLVDAGVRDIELTSFVRADRIPQLADAEQLLALLPDLPGVRRIALAPNAKAMARAAGARIDEVAVFAAASEGFSRANLGCSIEDSLVMFRGVARQALDAGFTVRGYVSTIVECPFQGAVSHDDVAQVLEAMLHMGCHEVSLGETLGAASAGEVQSLLDFLGSRFDVGSLAVHMHDTYGQGLANSLAAIEAGITTVDTSVAGLGGCPFAGGGARGNLATEDLVYALDRSGVETGIDLDKVIDTAWWISGQLGRPPVSRVATALGRKRGYGLEAGAGCS